MHAGGEDSAGPSKGCRVLWLQWAQFKEERTWCRAWLGASTRGHYMILTKACETCKETKPLSDFRLAPISGRAKLAPPSKNCKACHASGKVAHGYGK